MFERLLCCFNHHEGNCYPAGQHRRIVFCHVCGNWFLLEYHYDGLEVTSTMRRI